MRYNIIDLERTMDSGNITYWMPGARGYTNSQEAAGIYTQDRAIHLCREDCQGNTLMHPIDEKKYKTWEALKMLEKNPKLEFKSGEYDLYVEDGIIRIADSESRIDYDFTLSDTWEILYNEV